MNQTTPIRITRDIIKFCREIDPNSTPTFIQVNPTEEVRFNFCMTDVPAYALKNGGERVFGWTIWEVPGLFLEAEFHTCYKNIEGTIIDITPKPDGETHILFLPDTHRVYEGSLVKNFRKKLSDNAPVDLLFKISEKKDELKAKHFKNDSYDGAIVGFELQNWLSTLTKPKIKIGPNAPCPCGSGKKYKKCCRK